MVESQEMAPCVVEGRQFEVGPNKAIEDVPEIGLVHMAPMHTILGDPVLPAEATTPGTRTAKKGAEND